jgi:type II secretion system protein H
MPTSAPGIPERAKRRRGFTLIELLVVLAIVASLATMAALSLAPESGDRILRREAERLALLLEATSLEASVSGSALAWSFSETGYGFWTRDPVKGWAAVEGDEMFRKRKFADNAGVAFAEVAGRPLRAEERLVFRPARAQDFYIELRLGEYMHALRGDVSGKVTAYPVAALRTK